MGGNDEQGSGLVPCSGAGGRGVVTFKRKKSQWPQLLIALAIAVVGLSAIFFLRYVGVISVEEANLIATMFGGLAAAYLGASAAILFQQQKENEDRISAEVESINSTIFALIRRTLWLRSIKEDAIDPLRESRSRHLDLLPFISPPPNVSLKLEKLNELLVSGTATLLLNLAQEDTEFDSITELIRSRNEIHYEFQEKLSRIDLKMREALTYQKMVEVGLERSVVQLTSATDQLISLVDAALDSHIELAEKLRRAAKIRHPDKAFIAYVQLLESDASTE